MAIPSDCVSMEIQEINLLTEPHCEYGGKEYHTGETYRLGQEPFERICQNWGIGITGCFYTDEGGEEKFIAVGETATVGLLVHHCSLLSSRPGRIQYWTSVRTDVQPRNLGYNPTQAITSEWMDFFEQKFAIWTNASHVF